MSNGFINNERRSFVFYSSMLSTIEIFPEKFQGYIALGIMKFGLDIDLCPFPDDICAILNDTFEQIDRQKIRHMNKSYINQWQEYMYEEKIKAPANKKNYYDDVIKALRKMIVEVQNHNLSEDTVRFKVSQIIPPDIIKKYVDWRNPGKNLYDDEERMLLNLSPEDKENYLSAKATVVTIHNHYLFIHDIIRR